MCGVPATNPTLSSLRAHDQEAQPDLDPHPQLPVHRRQRCGRCPQHRHSSPVSELNGSLGLTLAPNGDLIAVNGSNGKLVRQRPIGS